MRRSGWLRNLNCMSIMQLGRAQAFIMHRPVVHEAASWGAASGRSCDCQLAEAAWMTAKPAQLAHCGLRMEWELAAHLAPSPSPCFPFESGELTEKNSTRFTSWPRLGILVYQNSK